jgi:hypothetical protein
MPIFESLGIEVAFDIAKQIFLAFPRSIDKWRFQRFFGPYAVSSDKIYAVVDPYSHPTPRVTNRFIKRFMGRKPDQPLVGEDDVIGVNVIRIVSYASALFSNFRKDRKSIPVVTDYSIVPQWNGTFICFGSGDSNIKTYDIENLAEQTFYSWSFKPDGSRPIVIGDRSFSIAGRKDYGILLRMKNPYHKDHLLFVCAGFGEWGTTGAAYHLLTRWKQIYKKYKRDEFCLIIEVDIGSDESAREVFSITRKRV